jgi:hypothetical protein
MMRRLHACTGRVEETLSIASRSSAAQKLTPAAVAASRTIDVALATSPTTTAPRTICLRRRANVVEMPSHSGRSPATSASPGSQATMRKSAPPIATAIAR